jgi:hypothetical protein
MSKHKLRLAAATAALLPAILIGASLSVPAGAAQVGASTASAGAGTAAHPKDARAAAAKSSQIRAAAGVGHAAVSWDQSAPLAVGASEYWTWHNAPTDAIFEVSLNPKVPAPTDICTLRVARTWYVKTPSGERQFRFQITNPAGMGQSCQGKVLLDWKHSGASFASGTLNAGATTSGTWNNANPARVYLVGLDPAKLSTDKCAIEVTSTSYARQTSGEVEFRFTLKNIGSVACGTQIHLTWLKPLGLPAAQIVKSPIMAPNSDGQVAWSLYPFSTDVVYVPGLSLTSTSTTAACQIALRSHDFTSFLQPDGATFSWLMVGTRNTGSVACKPSLMLALL